jgi:ribosomal protein S12 methylthiotransferase
MPKISLITLGCAKNLVDSEVMLGCLDSAGYQFTASLDEAEILVINTCGFIQSAREEADQAIEQGLNWKKKKTGRLLLVAGYYVERFSSYLKARYPQVDLWTGVSSFDRIDELIEKRRDFPGKGTFLLNHTTPRVVTTGPRWAYLKISEGCSHRCSFCSIPLIKGPYKSRAIDSVVQEVKNLAAMGIREINLISHDTTYFGRDRGMPRGLVRLLEKLLPVKGIDWIRILYSCPEEIDETLLELLTEEKMCQYLDLPFQHASQIILKKMGRSMNGPRALKLIGQIRKKVPGAAIRTSLIVGFPGEGKKEFKELKDFVHKAGFEHLGVFCYSAEPGTRAERFKDTVSQAEKEKRRQQIMSIQQDISRKFYESFVGQTLNVLVEGPDPLRPRLLTARARFQAPEVDGLVLVEGWKESKRQPRPAFLNVRIKRALTYDLVGKVIND